MQKDIFIIASSPRSGSTWLSNIVSSARGILIFNEPDNSKCKNSSLNELAYYINKDADLERQRVYLKKSLEEMREYRISVKSIKDKIGTLRKKFFENILLIGFKTVQSNCRLGWMRREMHYPKTIFLIRNPYGQVVSELQLLKKMHAKIKLPYEISKKKPDTLTSCEKAALLWKYENEKCIDENKDTTNFKIITYEDLCKNPIQTAKNIFEFLEIPFSNSTITYIQKTTNPRRSFITRFESKRFFSLNRNPKITMYKWKNELSAKQKNQIFNIIKDSELLRWWPELREDKNEKN